MAMPSYEIFVCTKRSRRYLVSARTIISYIWVAGNSALDPLFEFMRRAATNEVPSLPEGSHGNARMILWEGAGRANSRLRRQEARPGHWEGRWPENRRG